MECIIERSRFGVLKSYIKFRWNDILGLCKEDANDTAVVEVVSADIERDQTVEDKGGLPDTSNGERIIPDGINDDEANKRLEEDKEYRENEELSGKENQEIKAEVTEVLPEENKTTVEIDEGPKTSEDIISE